MASRLVPLLLIALLAIFHAQLWTGRGSVGSVAEMQRKLEAQKAANVRAQQANERLSSEVSDLKEGLEMVEEKARLELGMVKPNEILVQLQAASAPRQAPPTNKAAVGAEVAPVAKRP